MNRNQKIVIFIALILLLVCGIFIPYDGVHTRNGGEKLNLFLGYFPIFSPPSKKEMVKSFFKELDLEQEYKTRGENDRTFLVFNSKEKYVEQRTNDILNKYIYSSYTYESNINILRLIIQVSFLLILTIGLVLLFSDSKYKRGTPK